MPGLHNSVSEVIPVQKYHMDMGPILDGYGGMIWNIACACAAGVNVFIHVISPETLDVANCTVGACCEICRVRSSREHAVSEAAVDMSFTFSNEKYTDMHFTCGLCNDNYTAAVEEYRQLLRWKSSPDRRVSSFSPTFVRKWFKTSSTTGCGWEHCRKGRAQCTC